LPPTVLLLQKDLPARTMLQKALEKRGWAILIGTKVCDAQTQLSNQNLAVIITEVTLLDGGALDILAFAGGTKSHCSVLVVDNNASAEVAFQCALNGASGFIAKSAGDEQVVAAVAELLSDQQLPASASKENPFAGVSETIKNVERLAVEYSRSDLPVLIEGSTGTGKGVLCRWLQRTGLRSCLPFKELNCSGLAFDLLESELFGHERGAFTGAVEKKKGLFEVANKGTLFLDEIGDMAMNTQCKILKAVEEKRFRRLGGLAEISVDVRIIAATNRDIDALMGHGSFRADLFHRIAALRIKLPDLRERPEDIPHLARIILKNIAPARPIKLSDAAIRKLSSHFWPGNIRELQNVLAGTLLGIGERREIVAADIHLAEITPVAARSEQSFPSLREVQGEMVLAALDRARGNKRAAAKILGISTATLYNHLRALGREDATQRRFSFNPVFQE